MNEFSPSTPELRKGAPSSVASFLDLELPVAPDFCSRPPQLNPLDYVKWCEQMMKLIPCDLHDASRRLTEKAGLEFVL